MLRQFEVIPFDPEPPVPNVIELLEQLLEVARHGGIRAIAIAAVLPRNEDPVSVYELGEEPRHWIPLVAGMESTKGELLDFVRALQAESVDTE